MIIEVKWRGQTGTINENEAFVAMEAIEEHVSLFDILEMLRDRRTIKIGKISRAYSALLSEAGISVDPKDVRAEVVSSLKGGETPGDKMQAVMSVLGTLASLMLDEAPTGDGGQGNE